MVFDTLLRRDESSRDEAIRRAAERENAQLRKILSATLSALPIEQWQWQQRAAREHIDIAELAITNSNGARVTVVRTVGYNPPGAVVERTYQVYLERVLMGTEQYDGAKMLPEESIGLLYETVLTKLNPAR